jgi:hypothetical protein
MDTLPLILGAGAILAILLLNNNSTGTGNGSGSASGPVYQGADSGAGAPTIYQIPADSFAGFPNPNTLDLSDLLSSLATPSAGDTSNAKKDAVTPTAPVDAGYTYTDEQGNVQTLQAPFVSAAPSKKVTTVNAGLDDTGLFGSIVSLMGFSTNTVPLTGALLGMNPVAGTVLGGASILGTLFPKNDNGVVSPGGVLAQGADSGVNAAKKSSIPTYAGLENQYTVDPSTGFLMWNGSAGYGMDSNLATPFQASDYIYDFKGNLINDPTSSDPSKKAALTVLGPNASGMIQAFGSSSPLSGSDLAKAIAQGPGEQGIAWQNILANNPALAQAAAPAPAPAAKKDALSATTAIIPAQSTQNGGTAAPYMLNRTITTNGAVKIAASASGGSSGGGGGFGGGGAGGR